MKTLKKLLATGALATTLALGSGTSYAEAMSLPEQPSFEYTALKKYCENEPRMYDKIICNEEKSVEDFSDTYGTTITVIGLFSLAALLGLNFFKH